MKITARYILGDILININRSNKWVLYYLLGKWFIITKKILIVFDKINWDEDIICYKDYLNDDDINMNNMVSLIVIYIIIWDY